jgi:hypothetical protein
MNWLRRLPDSYREAPGLEWTIWRKLPLVLLAGTLLPIVCWLTASFLLPDTRAADIGHPNLIGDYVLIGMIVTFWLAMLTIAFGCIIVMVMKGHAYVADGFEVSHRDTPGPATNSVTKESSA